MVEVELCGESFENSADTYTLFGSETMPLVMSVIAHVGMECFATGVFRHRAPLSVLVAAVTVTDRQMLGIAEHGS